MHCYKTSSALENPGFLVGFTKLQKATISFVIFACVEQTDYHWKDLHEI
jgi:hypothetical protein